MGGIKLVSTSIKKHPKFGTSFRARNIETRLYSLGELKIKFVSEEWYDGFDTDVEVWIEMGCSEISMGAEDWGDCVLSRMGIDNVTINTKIMEGKGDGEKLKAISAEMESFDSAKEMNETWIQLAGVSKLSVEEFTDCLIEEFPYWFLGMPFLPALAAEEKTEDSSEEEDYSDEGKDYSDEGDDSSKEETEIQSQSLLNITIDIVLYFETWLAILNPFKRPQLTS